MKFIIYRVPCDLKEEEKQWLNSQKIYPAMKDSFMGVMTSFGVIVGTEVELAIKLRHSKIVSESRYGK